MAGHRHRHRRADPVARQRAGLTLVKLNRLYTGTGDDGSTGLVDGSRTSKASLRVAAVGDVDEANSALGLAIAEMGGDPALTRIQNELFDLGADLATPVGIEGALRIVAEQVTRLEREIDALTAAVPALTSFVLPGGNRAAAALHLARAIARRAERSVVALSADEPVNPLARTYLNRLSDLLFVIARKAAIDGGGEVLWKPGATR